MLPLASWSPALETESSEGRSGSRSGTIESAARSMAGSASRMTRPPGPWPRLPGVGENCFYLGPLFVCPCTWIIPSYMINIYMTFIYMIYLYGVQSRGPSFWESPMRCCLRGLSVPPSRQTPVSGRMRRPRLPGSWTKRLPQNRN